MRRFAPLACVPLVRIRLALIGLVGLGLVASLGCGSSAPPPGSQISPEPATGGVIFRYHDPEAARVCVVGDFNNWTLHADPLVDKNGDGQWTLFFPLKPGTYEYKFVVDGTRWIADPKNLATVPDGFEGLNSVVKVPDANRSSG